MDQPGAYSIGILSITSPATASTDWITGLDGMAGLNAQISLLFGGGNGASCLAYLQTSLDQGQTAIDIAAVQFGTVSGTVIFVLSASEPGLQGIGPTDGALPVESAAGVQFPVGTLNGVLGDRLRLKVVSQGVYSGSTIIACNAVAR